MTRPHRTGRGRRAVAAVLAVVALVTATACSDAYTAEEKARTDDGTDARAIIVMYEPRLAEGLGTVLDAYEQEDPSVRLIRVELFENQAAERIRTSTKPIVWFGDETSLRFSGDPGAADVDIAIGGEPLTLTWLNAAYGEGVAPGLEEFGASEHRTALCDPTIPCGESAIEVLTAAGITPDPGQTFIDQPTLAVEMADGEVDLAMMGLTHARDKFPAFSNRILDDAPVLPFALHRYGRSDASVAFVDWIASSDGLTVLHEALGLEDVR